MEVRSIRKKIFKIMDSFNRLRGITQADVSYLFLPTSKVGEKNVLQSNKLFPLFPFCHTKY